jgi:hypothetical protein
MAYQAMWRVRYLPFLRCGAVPVLSRDLAAGAEFGGAAADEPAEEIRKARAAGCVS